MDKFNTVQVQDLGLDVKFQNEEGQHIRRNSENR